MKKAGETRFGKLTFSQALASGGYSKLTCEVFGSVPGCNDVSRGYLQPASPLVFLGIYSLGMKYGPMCLLLCRIVREH